MFKVVYKKKIAKALLKLPESVRLKFLALQRDLALKGPVLPGWQNYKKLANGDYHCHLGIHHVACWRCENESITIEVYYVGSRENAPY